ncbi:uncharacterized protein LOC112468930 [Temnothorax curvispinosus]|uniref:Uncharacterized protein LOC112468930 n=1 Tax=Temnothorax curvispinosus TaxID=300111 RepID=A0A6J1RIG3_9HYME|nr:uncharacterized protein LOC112468930 [Temnothorax curvispinosus]
MSSSDNVNVPPNVRQEHPKRNLNAFWVTGCTRVGNLNAALEGQVYPKLKRFVPSLLTTPGSITKSWARLIPRAQAIVQTLQSQGVVSKYKLLEIWGLDEKCEILIYKIIFRYYHRVDFYTILDR